MAEHEALSYRVLAPFAFRPAIRRTSEDDPQRARFVDATWRRLASR
ncbi:MAG: hypothetical protein AAB654_00380 [Acidobacteriota bacterium]